MKGKLLNTVLISILCLIAIPSIAFAARPLSTDDAGTLAKAHIEIESAFEYADGENNEITWTTALKYGLLEKLHIGIEIPYQYINNGDDEDGLGDIVICSKCCFLKETINIPAMALGFSFNTKTGNDDKGLGRGETSYNVNAILTKEVNKIIVHLNLGYTYADKSYEDMFSYSSAVECPFNNKLNLVGELAGETKFEDDFNNNPLAALAGFNWAFSEILKFDFGMGLGISDASPDYTITSGLTASF